MQFGKNLKILIKKHGMTGGELAQKLDVGQSAISSYVTGVAFPKVEALILMRKIFKIDIDTLLFKDLSIELKKPINQNVNEEEVKYEVTKIYEPERVKIPFDTEGVGVLENLIQRIEILEKEIKELKQNK